MTEKGKYHWQWQRCFAQTFKALSPDQWRLFPASDEFLTRNEGQFVKFSFKLRMKCEEQDCNNVWNSEACTVWFSLPYYLKKKVRPYTDNSSSPIQENGINGNEAGSKKKKRRRRKKKKRSSMPEPLNAGVNDVIDALNNLTVAETRGSSGKAPKHDRPGVKANVYYRVWGQECMKCESGYFYDPYWPKDTMLLVMESLRDKILKRIYGVGNTPSDHPSGPRTKRKSGHKAQYCELCTYGLSHD